MSMCDILAFLQVKELKQNLSMYQAVSEEFACYVDGKQYAYKTFFKKDENTICFCHVSSKHKNFLIS